jgi:predicted lipoprotein with Yx(FWY)xxD motif
MRTMRATRMGVQFLAVGAALALLLAACGGDDSSSSNSSATTSAKTEAATTAAIVKTGTTTLGKVVTDDQGKTVYVFDKDKPGEKTTQCTGACAKLWPPLTSTTAKVAVGKGLDEDDFGTIKLADGTMQVTAYGMPLYRYSGDMAAGQTNGQGLLNLWYAAGANGHQIGGTAASSSPTTTAPAPTTTSAGGY